MSDDPKREAASKAVKAAQKPSLRGSTEGRSSRAVLPRQAPQTEELRRKARVAAIAGNGGAPVRASTCQLAQRQGAGLLLDDRHGADSRQARRTSSHARPPSLGFQDRRSGCRQRRGEGVKIRPTVSFHTFRHTCASLLFDDGRNIKQVQEWLGHAEPRLHAADLRSSDGRRDQRCCFLR
jgi:integrase